MISSLVANGTEYLKKFLSQTPTQSTIMVKQMHVTITSISNTKN